MATSLVKAGAQLVSQPPTPRRAIAAAGDEQGICPIGYVGESKIGVRFRRPSSRGRRDAATIVARPEGRPALCCRASARGRRLNSGRHYVVPISPGAG